MEEIQCWHCGHFFPKSPRQNKQCYCGKPECQKVRKAAWKRKKMRDDPGPEARRTYLGSERPLGRTSMTPYSALIKSCISVR